MKKTLTLITILFASIFAFAQADPELFPAIDRTVGYLGYYLEDGTNVVKPAFCSASYYTHGYYIVSKAKHEQDTNGEEGERHIKGTERVGLLNSKGEFIVNFEEGYNLISLKNGFINVSKNKAYGIINEKKDFLIPLEYEDLFAVNASTVVATKNNKMGIINLNNEVKVPFIYDKIFQGAEDIPISIGVFDKENPLRFIVKQGEKYGVINSNGKYIIALNHNQIVCLAKHVIIVKQGKKYGLLDDKNKVILPFKQYDDMEYSGGDEISFKKNNEKFIYNTHGKFIRKEKADPPNKPTY